MWLSTFFSVPYFCIFLCALPMNNYDCLSCHSGGWLGSGTTDPHCSQGTICGHDHPLHANRTWLHPSQRLGCWRKHLQLTVTFLRGHVDWHPHCIPANWSLPILGWQVSKTEKCPHDSSSVMGVKKGGPFTWQYTNAHIFPYSYCRHITCILGKQSCSSSNDSWLVSVSLSKTWARFQHRYS